MEDDELRAQVHHALVSSPFPENKLHLRTTLRSDWDDLSQRIVSLTERAAPLDALFDSLIDLEIYLPVPEHRESWDGEPDLLVAFATDDSAPPQGFLIGGEAVKIPVDAPPRTPMLILTRAERSFADVPERSEASIDILSNGPTAGQSGGSLLMTALSITGSWEPYWRGAPEFEVHLFVQDGASGDLVDVACAGEQMTGSRYFDYNNDPWYIWQGSVLIGTEAEVTSADDKIKVQVWERDSGSSCDGTLGGRPPKTDSQTEGDITAQPDDISRVLPSGTGSVWEGIAEDVLGILLSVFSAPDQWVGTVQWPPEGCWPHGSGGVSGNVVNTSGAAGWATLNNTFGERDPICLSVDIAGPDLIPSSDTYEWTAQPAGGGGSYSYEWYRKTDHWYPRGSATCHHDSAWQLVGTGQSYSTFVSGAEWDFRLRVDVISGNENASRTKHVLVTDEEPCPT